MPRRHRQGRHGPSRRLRAREPRGARRRRHAARRHRGAAVPHDNEANTDGNRYFFGFECENLGDGKDPWPEVQLEAIEKTAAAVCRRHGWNSRSVIGHSEWQPGKVDPRGFSMSTMRGRIHERLK